MRNYKVFSAMMLSLIMAFTIFPCTAFAATGAGVSDDDGSAVMEYEPGQLIIVTERGTKKKEMKALASDAEGDLASMSVLDDGTKVALVEVDEGSEISAMAALNRQDQVLLVQPNYKYELTEEETAYPNDPYYLTGLQEYLRADPLKDTENAGSINAAGAWEQLGNAPLDEEQKILAAVIDTGVRRNHEDLQGCLIKDKCVTYEKGQQLDFQALDDSDDDIGHGTSVTGIIGADIDNGVGVAGIAGGRAKVFVIDAGASTGGIHSIDVAMGIYYATDQGARVINLSVGGHAKDLMYERAVKYAWDHGTMCICAAGNDGTNHLQTPGDTIYAVNVMAHEWNGEPASFTCYGVERDISAPGAVLYTTGSLRKTSYESFDGTSAACPVVTGAVALMLSADPSLTPREIKNLLYTSTGKKSFSAKKEGQGFGRINLDTAVRNVLKTEKTDPNKIIINKTSINMYEGAETSIEYAVYPANTNTVEAEFSSSNEAVATVNSDGIVTAIAPGKATINVSCKGVTATCKVNVREAPYFTVDRKPYYTTGTITLDELIDYNPQQVESGDQAYEKGTFYHQYRIDLEDGETINAFMHSMECDAFLRIKDMDGNIVAEAADDGAYSSLTYTAEKAGTYQIQAFQFNPGSHATTNYYLKIASDRSFCQPEVTSTDYGQMRMSWPAVKDADCYLVRKYKDKEMTEVESERIVSKTKYTDTSYDESKIQYYSVTSCVQTISGNFYNGETPVVVKLPNPVTASGGKETLKAKALKKKAVTLAQADVLTVENAVGPVTFAKASGNKKISVTADTGDITVKKGLKKGIYTVKVKVTAAGDEEHAEVTKTVAVKIKVK